MAQDDFPELSLTPEEISPSYTLKDIEKMPLGTTLSVTDKPTEAPYLLPDGRRPVKRPVFQPVDYLQVNAIKDMGHGQSSTQDLEIEKLHRESGKRYSLEEIFEQVNQTPEFGQNKSVQNIAKIEIAKQFGQLVPEEDAPYAYASLKKKQAAEGELFDPTPKEGQETRLVYGTVKDATGKPQSFKVERIKDEQEDDIQFRTRKASAMKRAGTAEAVISGIDIDDDLTKAFLDPELDAVNIPLYRTEDGKHAFDVAAANGKLYRLYYNEIISKATAAGQEFTAEQREQAATAAKKRADQKISTIMHKNLGVYFVDEDPEKETQKIIDNPWYLGGRLTSPIRATLAGVQTADEAYNMVRTSMEDQGLLEYIGALSLGTSVGSAIHAGGWGTPEHIKMIRRGYDVTDSFGDVAKIMTPKFMERESIEAHNKEVREAGLDSLQFPLPAATFETLSGVPAMLGLILVDPDPTLLLGPIGKGAKTAGKALGIGSSALTAARLRSAKPLIEKISKLTPEELNAGKYEEIMSEIKEQDDDLYVYMNHYMAATRNIKPSADYANIRKSYEPQLKAIDKEIKQTKSRIKKDLASRKKANRGLITADLRSRLRELKSRKAEIELEQNERAFWTLFAQTRFADEVAGTDPLRVVWYSPKDLPGALSRSAKNAAAAKRAGEVAKASGDRLKQVRKDIQDQLAKSWESRKASLYGSNFTSVFVPMVGELQRAEKAYDDVLKFFNPKSLSQQEQISVITKMLAPRSVKKQADKLAREQPELAKALNHAFGSEEEVIKYLARRKELLKANLKIPALEAKAARGLTADAFLKAGKKWKESKKAFNQAQKVAGRSAEEIRALSLQATRAAMQIGVNKTTVDFLNDYRKMKDLEFAKSAKQFAEELGRSVDLVAKRVESRAAFAGAANPLARAIRRERRGETGFKKGDVVFDPRVTTRKIEETYGLEKIARFAEEVDAGNTQVGPRFIELISGTERVALSPGDQRILREGMTEFKNRADTLIARGEELGQGFLNDVRSAHRTGVGKRNFRKKFNEDLGFRSYVYDLQDTLRNALGSPSKWLAGVKQGPEALEYNGRMLDAYQKGIETAGALQQESALLTKGKRGSAIIDTLARYLGTTDEMEVVGGNFASTFMNTGPRPLFLQAAYQALSGFSDLSNAIKVGDDVLNAIVAATNPQAAEAVIEQIVKSADAEKGVKAFSKTLQGLSRAFIPSAREVANKDAAALAHVTATLLDKYIKSPVKGPAEIKKFMDNLAGATKSILWRETLDSKPKAYEMMRGAVVNGVVMDEAAKTVTNVFGKVTDDMVEDINKIIRGDFQDIDGQERAKDALLKLVEMGLPTTTKEVKRDIGKMVDSSAELVRLSRNADGVSGWATAELASKLDSLSLQIVKNLNVQSNKAKNGVAENSALVVRQILGLFRASITTGLMLPNPRYWVNNIVGDFSQMYFEEGAAAAAQLSAQNLVANLPFVGRPMQNRLFEWSENASKTNPMLAPVIHALIDPSLNKVWNGKVSDVITMPNGTTYTVGEIRRNMAADGVMDTFVQETLLEGLRKEYTDQFKTLPNWMKSILGGGTEKGKELVQSQNEMIQKHAAFVQQRQRAGLYMNIMRKGGSREDAKSAVSNALYDWKRPLSQGETKYLTQMFTFYRFQKLASEQIFRNVFKSFIDDAPRGSLRSRGAQNLGRIREMEQNLDLIPAALYHTEGAGEEGQAKTRGQVMDAQNRDVPFWWQGSRSTAYSMPIVNPNVIEFYKERGLNYTYTDLMVPPFTPLDMANQWLGAAYYIYGMSNPVGSPATSDATSELIFNPLTNAMVPALSTGAEMALKQYEGGTQYVGGGRTYLSASESDALPLILRFTDIKRDENGRAYVEGAGRKLVLVGRTMPFIGTQLAQYYAAYDNPYWAEGAAEGTSMMLLKLMGIAPRPKSPMRDLGFAVKERKQETEQVRRGSEGVTRQQEFVGKEQ